MAKNGTERNILRFKQKKDLSLPMVIGIPFHKEEKKGKSNYQAVNVSVLQKYTDDDTKEHGDDS